MQCVDSVRRNHDVSHSEVLKQLQNGPLICDLLTQATKTFAFHVNWLIDSWSKTRHEVRSDELSGPIVHANAR